MQFCLQLQTKELAQRLEDKYGISLSHMVCRDIIIEFCQMCFDELMVKKNDVRLKSLGVLARKFRKTKKARNPRTGDVVILPNREVISFNQSSQMKEILKNES